MLPDSLRISRRLAILFLALALAGCGPARRAEQPTEQAPVSLTLLTFDAGGVWGKAEAALIEQFRLQHPAVEIIPHQYRQSAQRYLTLSPPPDILALYSGYGLSQSIIQHNFVDITDMWEQTGLTADYPSSLRSQSTYEGKQYFLPVGYTWIAVYYNKQLFEDYKLAPPQTWNQFLRICDTLLAHGITPLALGGRGGVLSMVWFDYLDLRLNGALFHRQVLDGEIAYDDPALRPVFETWQQLLTHGYFVEGTEELTPLAAETAIVRGDADKLGGPNAAMLLSNPPTELPPAFQQELDFFPFPVIDPAVTRAEAIFTFGYAMPAGGEHLLESLNFLAYAGTAPAQQILAKQLNATLATQVPANTTVDPATLTPPRAQDLRRGRDIVASAGDVLPLYAFQSPDPMARAATLALRNFLREPENLDAFIAALEEARQSALTQRLFLSQQSPN